MHLTVGSQMSQPFTCQLHSGMVSRRRSSKTLGRCMRRCKPELHD